MVCLIFEPIPSKKPKLSSSLSNYSFADYSNKDYFSLGHFVPLSSVYLYSKYTKGINPKNLLK